jgi:hypothetical protein
MSEFPPSFSSGKTQQANENTQKPQLTDQQKRLIEDNYKDIKANLKKLLKSLGRKNLGRFKVNSDVLHDGLAHSVEAALKFDPNITPIEKFPTYAAYTCFYRVVDQFRRHNKHLMIGTVKNKIMDEIEEISLQKYGHIDNNFIASELSKYQDSISGQIKRHKVKQFGLDGKTFKDEKGSSLDEIDREEKFKLLKSKSDMYFTNLNCSISKIRKALVDEYILPKLQGKEYKSLTQISKEHNDITIGRLSQILRDDNIKNFLTICYGEKDKNGVPILR